MPLSWLGVGWLPPGRVTHREGWQRQREVVTERGRHRDRHRASERERERERERESERERERERDGRGRVVFPAAEDSPGGIPSPRQ